MCFQINIWQKERHEVEKCALKNTSLSVIQCQQSLLRSFFCLGFGFCFSVTSNKPTARGFDKLGQHGMIPATSVDILR